MNAASLANKSTFLFYKILLILDEQASNALLVVT
jgi:hypothetical protein